MLNIEELEEFFLGKMGDSKTTRWFIIREDQNPLYYLKDFEERTKAAIWTSNLAGAKHFMSENTAAEFIKLFSITGRNERIVEKEI